MIDVPAGISVEEEMNDNETFSSRGPYCGIRCIRCAYRVGRTDDTTGGRARRGCGRGRPGREGTVGILPTLAEYLCEPLGLAHVALLPLHRAPRLRISAATRSCATVRAGAHGHRLFSWPTHRRDTVGQFGESPSIDNSSGSFVVSSNMAPLSCADVRFFASVKSAPLRY